MQHLMLAAFTGRVSTVTRMARKQYGANRMGLNTSWPTTGPCLEARDYSSS